MAARGSLQHTFDKQFPEPPPSLLESLSSSSSSSSKWLYPTPGGGSSFQLCTEGLGSESSADVQDLNFDHKHKEEDKTSTKHPAALKNQNIGEFRTSRSSRGAFPPPISCIASTGKPLVCFKSCRQDGRFVLTLVRIPAQEILHACRENGRLKLQFVQPGIVEDDNFTELEDGGGQDHDQNWSNDG